MADTTSSLDAIDESEITGTAIPATSLHKSNPKRNAFSELMAAKPKRKTEEQQLPRPKLASFDGRSGLAAYIVSPETFPPSRVIYHNTDFVLINDLYPKSSVHLLLLPRDPSKTVMHPLDALDQDPAFLTKVQQEVKKVRVMVAGELRRRFGKFSTKEQVRIAAMEMDDPPTMLPDGRDWDREVISGIHAHPSMNHLHVHVLSVDRHSECLRHRKHYNSFNTPFLIDVDDFPLAEDDLRRHPGREGFLDSDMCCWRCGKNFKNKFARLKDHLENEFQEWKKV